MNSPQKGGRLKAFAAFGGPVSVDTPESWMCRGWNKYEEGDWDGAIADLSRAVQLDPKNARCWSRRGVVRVLNGQVAEALADCAEAVRLEPESAIVWSHQGAVKFEAGDYGGAVEDCSKAIALRPGLSDAWVDRGGAKLELGNAAGAIADYTEALNLAPNSAPTLTNRAIAKHDLGDFDGAMADCRKALQIRPSFGHAAITLKRAKEAQERRCKWHLELLPSIVVPSYLEPYGYAVEGPQAWRSSSQGGPKLGVKVLGHTEEGGHTWYALDCELEQQESNSFKGAALPVLKWKMQRRLVQIREDLHDPIKAELDQLYMRLFGDTPFARTGGPVGTTARLRDWFMTLCGCLNAKQGSPELVARTLQFLEAPDPVLPNSANAEIEAEIEVNVGDSPFSKSRAPLASVVSPPLLQRNRARGIVTFTDGGAI